MLCVGRCFLIGSIHSGFFLFFPSSGLRRHLHGIEPFASQRVLSVSSHLEHKRSGLDPVWPSHCDQAVMARGEDALRPMWLMQASQTWKVKCSVGFFFFLHWLGLPTSGAVRACLLDFTSLSLEMAVELRQSAGSLEKEAAAKSYMGWTLCPDYYYWPRGYDKGSARPLIIKSEYFGLPDNNSSFT